MYMRKDEIVYICYELHEFIDLSNHPPMIDRTIQFPFFHSCSKITMHPNETNQINRLGIEFGKHIF